MQTYKVISYDVWGNPKDGFEVNAAHYTPYSVELSDEWTDKELRRALRDCGFCNSGIMTAALEINGDCPECIYITQTNSKVGYKPFCELRKAD